MQSLWSVHIFSGEITTRPQQCTRSFHVFEADVKSNDFNLCSLFHFHHACKQRIHSATTQRARSSHHAGLKRKKMFRTTFDF